MMLLVRPNTTTAGILRLIVKGERQIVHGLYTTLDEMEASMGKKKRTKAQGKAAAKAKAEKKQPKKRGK